MNLVNKLLLKVPLGVGELAQVAKDKRQQLKETRAAHKRKEFPIHYTKPDCDRNSENKFMAYCLSLIKRERPLYFNILNALMSGYSHKQIKDYLVQNGHSVTVARISRLEKEAVRYVKRKIQHLRDHGIPILGGI